MGRKLYDQEKLCLISTNEKERKLLGPNFEINRLETLSGSLITDAHILFEEILSMEKELGISTDTL